MTTTTHRQLVQTGIVTEDLGSTTTHVNHIDTYSEWSLPSEWYVQGEWEFYEEQAGVNFEELGLDTWSDVEFTVDHDALLRDLAQSSILAIRDNLPDDSIVKAVEWTEEVWSPREYNFATDGYMARWTIDADALERWLTDNDIVLHDGHGIDGFLRTADDEFWYLATAMREYLDRAVFPNGTYEQRVDDYRADESEHVTVRFSDAAIEKIAAAGGNTDDLPRVTTEE